MTKKTINGSVATVVEALGIERGERVVLGPARVYSVQAWQGKDGWGVVLARVGALHTLVLGSVKPEVPDWLLQHYTDVYLVHRSSDLTESEAEDTRHDVIKTLRAAGAEVTIVSTEIEAAEQWVAIGGGERAREMLAAIRAEQTQECHA